MSTSDDIHNEHKEEFDEKVQNSTIYDASTKSPIVKTHTHSKLLAFFLLFALATFFLLYIAPLFFNINSIWLENISLSLQAFDFMCENGSFLAPAIFDDLQNHTYIKEYPLIFWILYFVANTFPLIASQDLFFFAFIFSLFFYALSTYFLALTLRLNSSIALGAVCILFTSFFSLIYMQFVGFDLIFASLLNFSLAFFYRAWTKAFAPFSLFIAFALMTLSFFAGGFFALFLPLLTGIIFTIIQKKPTRLAKGDGLAGAFLLFVSSGIMFILFYHFEHDEYLGILADLDNFKKAWASTTFLAHIKHYLLFLSLSFLPYIFVFFFINQSTTQNSRAKNSYKHEKKGFFSLFRRQNTLISAIEIPDPSEVQEKAEEKSGAQTEEDIINVSEIISLKQEDTKENDIPTASFALVPEPKEEVTISVNSPLVFLYSLIIVGLLLISFFPYISFSYVLMLLPALAIVFAKKIMHFSVRSSRIFFSLFAWTIVLLGFVSLFFAILPELRSVRPEFFGFISNALTITFADVPKISFFIFAFIAFTLALLLLFSDKSSNWRAFSRSIMAMLILSWALNFTIYPHINLLTPEDIEKNIEQLMQEENMQDEDLSLEDSKTLEKGKALLEQSESLLEEGKYFLQLPKSLMPESLDRDEDEDSLLKDPLEGIKPIYPLLPLPPVQDESLLNPPLPKLFELENPALPTYTL